MLILIVNAFAGLDRAISEADDPVDCQSYNPGSMITSCNNVDLCCDDEECWYQINDLQLDDPDEVLDLICEFHDFGDQTFNISEDIPRYNRFGPWMDFPLM